VPVSLHRMRTVWRRFGRQVLPTNRPTRADCLWSLRFKFAHWGNRAGKTVHFGV
jgi:hypothetical protein